MAVCKLEHLFVHTDGRKCCPPATQVAIFKAEVTPVRPRYQQSTLRWLKQITRPSRVHSTFHLKFYLQKDPEDLTKSKNAAECPSKKPFSQQALVEEQEVPESRTLRHCARHTFQYLGTFLLLSSIFHSGESAYAVLPGISNHVERPQHELHC